MSSETEKTELIAATHALEEFVKILVNEYPLIFKDESAVIKIDPSIEKQFFPHEVSLEIKKQKW
jgi:hypothetical protein